MSIGFRKSLFGFNSNDVVEYINKTHKKFAQKEKDFLESIDKLNKSLDEAKAEQEAIRLEKIELDKKINEFNTKNEELEKLYINTQKLNDIAMINSKKIIENGENTNNFVGLIIIVISLLVDIVCRRLKQKNKK